MHGRFADLNPGYGGVFGPKFPLMEDMDGNISRKASAAATSCTLTFTNIKIVSCAGENNCLESSLEGLSAAACDLD